MHEHIHELYSTITTYIYNHNFIIAEEYLGPRDGLRPPDVQPGEPFQDDFRPELYNPYAGARYVVQATRPYEVAVNEPWDIFWEPGNEIHPHLTGNDEVG